MERGSVVVYLKSLTVAGFPDERNDIDLSGNGSGRN
jgi:hypothetical protein